MQQNIAKNEGFLTQENEAPRQWLLLRNEPGEGVFAYTCEEGLSRSKVNFIDRSGRLPEKTGKQRIVPTDPLTEGISKQSKPQEIADAIKKVEEALKNEKMSPGRRKALEAWKKVAKRGFRFKGICPGLIIGLWDDYQAFLRSIENNTSFEEQLESEQTPLIFTPWGTVMENPVYVPPEM